MFLWCMETACNKTWCCQSTLICDSDLMVKNALLKEKLTFLAFGKFHMQGVAQ